MGNAYSLAASPSIQEDETGSEVPATTMKESAVNYISRKGLAKFGIRNLASRISYKKGCNNSSCAATVVSDETSKDMGGLLQLEGRDFLFFLAGAKEAAALSHNRRLSRAVLVIRKVHGPGPDHTSTAWYVCCGQYEVVDAWQLDHNKLTYFKLLRLGDQPPLIPQEMYYKDEACIQARGFSTTYRIYKELLGMDCSKACERLDPQHAGSFPTPAGSDFCPCDVCEVCGINGDQIDMMLCECCNERGKEVQACYTCVPQKQLEWLLNDPELTHHWRCSSCRTAGLRPQAGAVFEDVPAATQAPTTSSDLPAGSAAAGAEASTEATEEPDSSAAPRAEAATPLPSLSVSAKLEPIETACLHTPSSRALTPWGPTVRDHGIDPLTPASMPRSKQAMQDCSSVESAGKKRAYSSPGGPSGASSDRVEGSNRSKCSRTAAMRSCQAAANTCKPAASNDAGLSKQTKTSGPVVAGQKTLHAPRRVSADKAVDMAERLVNKTALDTTVPASELAATPVERAAHPVATCSGQYTGARTAARPARAPVGAATAPAEGLAVPADGTTALAGAATGPVSNSGVQHTVHVVKGMGTTPFPLRKTGRLPTQKPSRPPDSEGQSPALDASPLPTPLSKMLFQQAPAKRQKQTPVSASASAPLAEHVHAEVQGSQAQASSHATRQMPTQAPAQAMATPLPHAAASAPTQVPEQAARLGSPLNLKPAQASQQLAAQAASPMSPPMPAPARVPRQVCETVLTPHTEPAQGAASAPPQVSANVLRPASEADTLVKSVVQQQAKTQAPTAAAASPSKAPAGPVTIADMVAAVNTRLTAPHQLMVQHTLQLQAAFGDVQLLQDLRNMEGDLLNSQLRSLATFNPLQVCAVRQELCRMQQC